MELFPPTIILRHRRENLKKCSLRGLESRSDLHFYTYPKQVLPPLDGYLLLSFDGPLLQREDASLGLFLIDGTWRHSEVMFKQLSTPHTFQTRSLPKELQTAYPRKQEDCSDPKRGLATVEALYAAYKILGRNTEGLLEYYHWNVPFLEINQALFKSM